MVHRVADVGQIKGIYIYHGGETTQLHMTLT